MIINGLRACLCIHELLIQMKSSFQNIAGEDYMVVGVYCNSLIDILQFWDTSNKGMDFAKFMYVIGKYETIFEECLRP